MLGWRVVAVLVAALLIPMPASAGAPAAPANFLVRESNGVAVLSWDSSESVTYRVYAGLSVDDLALAGSTTAVTFNTGAEGAQSWYAVGAVDSTGMPGPVSFSNAGGTTTGQCVAVSKNGGVGISIRNCVSF